MLRKSPYFWCCTVLGSKKQINRTELMTDISDLDLVNMHSRSTGTWSLDDFIFAKTEPREINTDTFLPLDEDWRLPIKN